MPGLSPAVCTDVWQDFQCCDAGSVGSYPVFFLIFCETVSQRGRTITSSFSQVPTLPTAQLKLEKMWIDGNLDEWKSRLTREAFCRGGRSLELLPPCGRVGSYMLLIGENHGE